MALLLSDVFPPERDQFITLLVPLVRPQVQSEPEAVLLAAALLNAVPLVPQYPIDRYHVDFALVERGIAVEIDGYQYHSDREAFGRDRVRDRRLLALGWRVLRFTAPEVFDNPGHVLAEIVTAAEPLPFSEALDV